MEKFCRCQEADGEPLSGQENQYPSHFGGPSSFTARVQARGEREPELHGGALEDILRCVWVGDEPLLRGEDPGPGADGPMLPILCLQLQGGAAQDDGEPA